MAISLESISRGKAHKAPRIVMLGTEKVGKSSTAAQAPAPIFIPVRAERGIDELDVAKFPPVQTFDDLRQCLGSLAQEDHEFKTVVIDSVSTLEPVIWDEACKMANPAVQSVEQIGGGFGKGYIEALRYWRELIEALDYLRDTKDMGCVLIGHVVAKDFNDPEAGTYTTYTFDIHKKAEAAINRWADAILFCAMKKASVQKEDAGFNKTNKRAIAIDGGRVVYTEKRPAHPGGNRFGMKFELPLSWEAIQGEIDKSRA